jgi:hypothetical protein
MRHHHLLCTAQHILDTRYVYNTTEDSLEVLHIKKDWSLNTLKDFHMYNLSKQKLQMNNTFTDTHNPIFDLIIKYFPFIHQWLYSPLLGPGLFFSFIIFLYTDGRTPWMSDQLITRPLPTHRTIQTQNKCTHRHPCLEWDSNPQSQHLSK